MISPTMLSLWSIAEKQTVTINFRRIFIAKVNISYIFCCCKIISYIHTLTHGLRTPNEGINQRYLKNWADVADKICFGRT